MSDAQPSTDPQEAALLAFMATYEPVVGIPNAVYHDPDEHLCLGGCGRALSGVVALCVRCRNRSSHPAFGVRDHSRSS